MELHIEKALQQGIAAHKEGRLQDAERFYRTILRAKPEHSHANHNLGVLAVAVGKPAEAIPFFKLALEVGPNIEQFWLSYIDALVKTEKFDDARRVLADAQQAGIAMAKLQTFEGRLQSERSSGGGISHQKLGNTLQSHQDELSPAIELREVGKYKEAQEWLSNFIEHDSKNVEALSLLSQVLLLDKKEAEAERVLTEAASIDSELPSVYRNQARLLLKQSRAAEALDRAHLGCKRSPEEFESLMVLAACLVANQRDLEARPLIEKILKAEPDYAEAYATRALIKLREKDPSGAIKDVETTVSLKPHLTQMWQLLSSLHYQANNLSGAIEALRSALKNESKNANIMAQLGEFLRQNNEAGEAINILEVATKLAPEDAKAWANLGVALQQEKRKADAKIAYEKALALDPESAAVSSNLGAIAGEAEDWESALQYFERALEIQPNLAEAHSNLGGVLKELGRLHEALSSYNQAKALKPDSAELHNNLGVTLYELGRLGEAEASYERAIALKPDFAEAHSNLGSTLNRLGRLDAAVASYTQAIASKSDYAEAYNNLGNTLNELGRLDDAVASYTRAIALRPSFAEAHSNLGNALTALGRLHDAKTSYTQAIALKKDHSLAHYGLGKVVYKMNNKNAAIDSFKKAAAIDPKSKDIQLLLSVLQGSKARKDVEGRASNLPRSDCHVLSPSKILELKRPVERELVAHLYNKELTDLDKEKDPSFGNAKGSKYELFEDSHPTIQSLESDLHCILTTAFNSEIFIKASFFSIFGAGGGTGRHNHVTELDKDPAFSLAKRKYALVYYLSVGDQSCTQPGFLKLFDPDHEILPSEGSIIIFPADRYHSSFYGGNKDRVIIGVNFYTL